MHEAEDIGVTIGPQTEDDVMSWRVDPAEIRRHPISTILDVVDAEFSLAKASPMNIGLMGFVRDASERREDQRSIPVAPRNTEMLLAPIQYFPELRLGAD